MCLIVVHFQVHEGLPLVVAANRDERYSRPAASVELRSASPKVLAGRDELAGGTWLAVNEHGVVAGLTNQPMPSGPDRSKRSRGGLPLLCTDHANAADAVEAFVKAVDPSEYNPCWLLVGDRERLFALEVDGNEAVRSEELEPGRHVLENSPISRPTAKSVAVTSMDREIPADLDAVQLAPALAALLGDHRPSSPLPEGAGDPRAARRPDLSSACVHSDGYGTRSSTVVLVPREPSPPRLHFADGAPCVTPFADMTPLWESVPNR